MARPATPLPEAALAVLKLDPAHVAAYNFILASQADPNLARCGMNRHLFEAHRKFGIPTHKLKGMYQTVVQRLAALPPSSLQQYTAKEEPAAMSKPTAAGATVALVRTEDKAVMQEIRLAPAPPDDSRQLAELMDRVIEVAGRICQRTKNQIEAERLEAALDRVEAERDQAQAAASTAREVIQRAIAHLNDLEPKEARDMLRNFLAGK